MKSTGVVRRIDDLGRIVIPKEIRKNLRIKEGDNLEIYINSEDLVLKKYSYLKKISDIAQELSDTISKYLDKTVLVTDTDSIIAMTGKNKKKYINKNLSKYLTQCIQRRQSFIEIVKKKIEFVEGEEEFCNYLLSTIITNSEVVGSIVIFSIEEKLVEEEFKIANIASSFIAKYLE